MRDIVASASARGPGNAPSAGGAGGRRRQQPGVDPHLHERPVRRGRARRRRSARTSLRRRGATRAAGRPGGRGVRRTSSAAWAAGRPRPAPRGRRVAGAARWPRRVPPATPRVPCSSLRPRARMYGAAPTAALPLPAAVRGSRGGRTGSGGRSRTRMRPPAISAGLRNRTPARWPITTPTKRHDEGDRRRWRPPRPTMLTSRNARLMPTASASMLVATPRSSSSESGRPEVAGLAPRRRPGRPPTASCRRSPRAGRRRSSGRSR